MNKDNNKNMERRDTTQTLASSSNIETNKHVLGVCTCMYVLGVL